MPTTIRKDCKFQKEKKRTADVGRTDNQTTHSQQPRHKWMSSAGLAKCVLSTIIVNFEFFLSTFWVRYEKGGYCAINGKRKKLYYGYIYELYYEQIDDDFLIIGRPGM